MQGECSPFRHVKILFQFPLMNRCVKADYYTRSIGERVSLFQEGIICLKLNFKKMILGGIFLLLVFAVGFAGGIFFSTMAAGMGEESLKTEETRAFSHI